MRITLVHGAMLFASLLWAQDMERTALSVQTASGLRVEFQVEIADTSARRHQGLMSHRTLAEDAGMLFIFDQVRPVSMWMRGTPLSLDMLFIDDDGRIVRIVPATTPESMALIPSGEPVRAVLEVNAGTCQRHGIRAGDQIEALEFSRLIQNVTRGSDARRRDARMRDSTR